MSFSRIGRFSLLSLCFCALATGAYAQDSGRPVTVPAHSEQAPAAGDDLAAIAKETTNPVGSAWMLWMQNDYTHLDGDDFDGRWSNSFKFQPVMSFPFELAEDNWNLVVRPVFQCNSSPMDESFGTLARGGSPLDIDPDEWSRNAPHRGRTEGLGDTALVTLAGPARSDGVIWGLGMTQIFPTAEHDVLGQGKFQAGPAALIARLAPNPGGWNMGLLAQHWWSYAGEDDREHTSQTDLQYFLNYRLSGTELVGMTPNVRINWEADSGEKVNFPIGLGYSNVIRMGNTPVRLAAEIQRSVIRGDEWDADWNLRFMFIPVVKNPFL
ncbi:hypothetical protein [Halomonas litopenaei]|uniref:hypothetical protein n=1 Tax=Halomonas litopenaei TaxID=2109328 RepID=UPI001A8DC72F|nr:hypothetical protein [Halomonas litopenaei]MBN8413843.1 hypothetical protein [Halomonas litopenaei]